jgi:hypothetical protein
MRDKLTQYKSYQDDIVYLREDILSLYPVEVPISETCFLFFRQEHESWLEFIFVEWNYSDDKDYYRCIFHGCGASSLNLEEFSLRELRHMYFGEQGYVFYMPGKALISAMQVLAKYFDM